MSRAIIYNYFHTRSFLSSSVLVSNMSGGRFNLSWGWASLSKPEQNLSIHELRWTFLGVCSFHCGFDIIGSIWSHLSCNVKSIANAHLSYETLPDIASGGAFRQLQLLISFPQSSKHTHNLFNRRCPWSGHLFLFIEEPSRHLWSRALSLRLICPVTTRTSIDL
jgi:hypothetical protein